MFWDLAVDDPASPALILSSGDAISYRDLQTSADAWTDRLRRAVRSGSGIAALEFATNPTAIAAYLGALRAGIPILPVEPDGGDAQERLLARWQPDVLIKNDELVEHPFGSPGDAALPACHPDLRLLLSTSGTTGDPKLVRLSGRNIDANAESIVQYLGISTRDRAATTLPLFYSYGLSVLNSYLSAGATLVLTSSSLIEPEFWDQCAALQVTSLALVPHQFELLSAGHLGKLDLPSLRYVTQAGGKLAGTEVRRFWERGQAAGWELFIMYGQTEASPRISYVPPNLLPHAADTIGVAVPGGTIDIIDTSGTAITEPGIPGELRYSGPNVMMGYATDRSDLARGIETTSLETGDIAERTENGLFRIVGRKKRFVKMFGLRISLDQTEELLRNAGIPAYVTACDERLVVLHINEGDGPAASAAVENAFDLPHGEVIAEHLREVPLSPSGKPDHKALTALAAKLVAARANETNAFVSLEQALARATRSHKIRPGDSFNSLGGDSLSYIQMQLALEDHLGEAPAGWESMPLSQLQALEPSRKDGPVRGSATGDAILRIFAITLIVAQHASNFALYGGVWMLIALMGASSQRFQLTHVVSGRPIQLLRKMLYPIVPAYLLILLIYALFRDPVPPDYFLFLGNYHNFAEGSLLTAYWFVSFYVQIVLIMALVAAIPVARRALAARPWALPLTLAILTFATVLLADLVGGYRVNKYAEWPLRYIASHGLLECLPIFLIGWCLRSARSAKAVALTGVLAVVYVSYFYYSVGGALKAVLLAITFLVIRLDLVIAMPRPAAKAVGALAGATLFVYLVHPVVVFVFHGLNAPEMVKIALVLAFSFPAALVIRRVFDTLDHMVIHRHVRATGAS